MAKPEYETNKAQYEELLKEARTMTMKNINIALRQRGALHNWAVRAYEQALNEKRCAAGHTR